MRLSRTATTILGLFLPLVIQAQPFGETELVVFDTGFLPVPPGPAARPPREPAGPEWVPVTLDPAVTDRSPWVPGGPV